MTKEERYCTIQVDVDGLWVLNRLLGLEIPLEPDPVFEIGIARILSLLKRYDVRATFFAVARDLESKRKEAVFKQIRDAGHEIASHGSAHRYLNDISEAEREDEIAGSRAAIERALAVRVDGFKAAGFAAHKLMVGALERAGYGYDSSVLGSPMGIVMELMSGVRYQKRAMVMAPNRPYVPSRTNIFRRGKSGIIEIPVTVLPALRMPKHFSYTSLGGKYYSRIVRTILRNTRLRVVNYLFHPLDMLDDSVVKIDRKVHGLSIPATRKIAMARLMIRFFRKRYMIVTSGELKEIIRKES